MSRWLCAVIVALGALAGAAFFGEWITTAEAADRHHSVHDTAPHDLYPGPRRND